MLRMLEQTNALGLGNSSAVYDLKAVNPNRKADVDDRTPAQLIELLGLKGHEVAAVLAALRALG